MTARIVVFSSCENDKMSNAIKTFMAVVCGAVIFLALILLGWGVYFVARACEYLPAIMGCGL